MRMPLGLATQTSHNVAQENQQTPTMHSHPTNPAPDLGISATQQALGTVELLEQILLKLDLVSCLLSQRVNRAFRDVVRGSSAIRQYLWLEPSVARERKNAMQELNPLLNHRIWPGHSHIKSLTMSGREIWMYTTSQAGGIPADDGSWREMLVVQPHDPGRRFKLWCFWRTKGDWVNAVGVRRFEAAPTAGELVELALEAGPGMLCGNSGIAVAECRCDACRWMVSGDWRHILTGPL